MLILSRVVPRNEEVSDTRKHHGAAMARLRVITFIVLGQRMKLIGYDVRTCHHDIQKDFLIKHIIRVMRIMVILLIGALLARLIVTACVTHIMLVRVMQASVLKQVPESGLGVSLATISTIGWRRPRANQANK